MVMETTFCELRCKEVINLADGRRLGRVIDIVIDLKSGKVRGIVVPGACRNFSLFRRAEELFIPWCDICKIGDDVIIVELKPPRGPGGPAPCPPPRPEPPCPPPGPAPCPPPRPEPPCPPPRPEPCGPGPCGPGGCPRPPRRPDRPPRYIMAENYEEGGYPPEPEDRDGDYEEK